MVPRASDLRRPDPQPTRRRRDLQIGNVQLQQLPARIAHHAAECGVHFQKPAILGDDEHAVHRATQNRRIAGRKIVDNAGGLPILVRFSQLHTGGSLRSGNCGRRDGHRAGLVADDDRRAFDA